LCSDERRVLCDHCVNESKGKKRLEGQPRRTSGAATDHRLHCSQPWSCLALALAASSKAPALLTVQVPCRSAPRSCHHEQRIHISIGGPLPPHCEVHENNSTAASRHTWSLAVAGGHDSVGHNSFDSSFVSMSPCSMHHASWAVTLSSPGAWHWHLVGPWPTCYLPRYSRPGIGIRMTLLLKQSLHQLQLDADSGILDRTLDREPEPGPAPARRTGCVLRVLMMPDGATHKCLLTSQAETVNCLQQATSLSSRSPSSPPQSCPGAVIRVSSQTRH